MGWNIPYYTRDRRENGSNFRQKLPQFSACEFEGNAVMTFDEQWEINIEQLTILHANTPIDDAHIHLWRIAEEKRGQRIVYCTSRQIECVETVANEVSRHSWSQVANIVPSQGCRAFASRQPERFFRCERCRVSHNTL